jgi:hypothetical protein
MDIVVFWELNCQLKNHAPFDAWFLIEELILVVGPVEIAPASVATAAVRSERSVAALGLWPGFVHNNVATAHIGVVEHADSFISFLIRGHFNKTEALGPAGEFINDHLCADHSPGLGEMLFQGVIIGAERDSTHK